MEIHRRTNDGNLVLAEKNPFRICIIYGGNRMAGNVFVLLGQGKLGVGGYQYI